MAVGLSCVLVFLGFAVGIDAHAVSEGYEQDADQRQEKGAWGAERVGAGPHNAEEAKNDSSRETRAARRYRSTVSPRNHVILSLQVPFAVEVFKLGPAATSARRSGVSGCSPDEAVPPSARTAALAAANSSSVRPPS